VNTHRPEPSIEMLGGTTYIFVTGGIEESVRRARELAGDRDVLIAGGVELARQALRAGLVDELALHVAHVVLGHGERFFDAVAAPLKLRPIRTIAGTGATHVSYDVLR
jgi:dihydrofolate reductase